MKELIFLISVLASFALAFSITVLVERRGPASSLFLIAMMLFPFVMLFVLRTATSLPIDWPGVIASFYGGCLFAYHLIKKKRARDV